MDLIASFKQEFFNGWTKFESAWVIFFLLIQIIIFVYQPASWIESISAISGILCVVLVAKGKISNFLFGLIFAYSYAYISFSYQVYGEMIIALAVYLPAQFIGYFLWNENMQSNRTIIAHYLTVKQLLLILLLALIGTFIFTQFLIYINSAVPFLDGLSMVLILIAQILMIFRYSEQWILWIIVNIVQIALWIRLYFTGNNTSIPILVMHIMYLLNSLYGYWNWKKLELPSKVSLQSKF